MTVIDLKPKRRHHAPRDLVALDKSSGPARFYDKMRRDIASDLGHRGNKLTRIELELIKGFCGCATRLEYLNFQILLGDASECDLAGYAQLASTMLRIGSKLGLHRRQPEKQGFGAALSVDYERQQQEDYERDQQRRAEFEEKQRAARASTPEELTDVDAQS
jgi:hypothetical protein